MNAEALKLLLKKSPGQRFEFILPVISYTIITILSSLVSVITWKMWNINALTETYKVLGIVLIVFMVIPLISLSSLSVKLTTGQQRLKFSSLRLVGASKKYLIALALFEVSKVIISGILCGTFISLILLPLANKIVISDVELGTKPYPPLWLVAVGMIMLVGISVVSSLVEIRKVMINPYEIRTRAVVQNVHWVRVVLAMLMVAFVFAILHFFSLSWGMVGIVAALSVVIFVLHSLMGVIAPFLLAFYLKRKVKTEGQAQKLVAYRRILDSPQAAWRQVSLVSLTSFTTMFSGIVLGYLNTIKNSPESNIASEQIQIFTDVRTVLTILLVASFLSLVCSILVAQVADILDRKELYRSLYALGTGLETIQNIRVRAVLIPLWCASIGGALIAATLIIPAFLITLVTSPLFMVMVVLCIASGVFLSYMAIKSTSPLLRATIS